jgi:hypothetical protein
MTVAQFGPFRLRLLHAILAEDPLTGSDDLDDFLGRMSLADRDQRDTGRLAADRTGRNGDFIAHPVESFDDGLNGF